MVYLVDINVLIARLDSDHEHHQRTVQWWHRNVTDGWATCPITENGFIRILGRPTYPGWPGTPERAASALRQLIVALPGHRFFADEISPLSKNLFPNLSKVTPSQITDLYLLALAVHHDATFVSHGKRVKAQRIPGGTESFLVIK